MDKIKAQQDQFEKWCGQWEDAMEKGVFEDAPKPPVPSSQTSDSSFFGLVNTDPTPCPSDADAGYWNDVHVATERGYGTTDPLVLIDHMSHEKQELLKEEKRDKKSLGASVKAVADSPNPIRHSSVGNDRELEDGPLGVTYSPEDLDTLAEMKLKLHDLQDQLNSFEATGKNSTKFQGQIENIREKIEELSSDLTHSHPTEPSFQGE